MITWVSLGNVMDIICVEHTADISGTISDVDSLSGTIAASESLDGVIDD